MFGYIVANGEDLSPEERIRYRSVYCGLCKRLGDVHGELSRFALTYDMSFLIILLESLYEPETETGSIRCITHPVKKHTFSASDITDYAADMTVALMYYKCFDDWNDDKKTSSRVFAGILKNKFEKVEKRWPVQCGVTKRSLEILSDIEKRGGTADEAINSFGHIMAEMFVIKEDEWSGALRAFGEGLGRFIYLMDAVMDFEKDSRSGSYNPVIAMGKQPEEMTEVLTFYIGAAAEVFEKLPLVQDINILRSIIYNGVWQKYRLKQAKKGTDGTGSL